MAPTEAAARGGERAEAPAVGGVDAGGIDAGGVGAGRAEAGRADAGCVDGGRVGAGGVGAGREPAARDGTAGTRRWVAGSPVDAVTLEGAVAFVASALTQRRACRIVVTNANKAWLAARDARLRAILEAADLVVAEWATAWAARRLGVAGVEHVGGITLMVRLLAEAEARGWSCYFLGAAPGVADAMVARLRRERPRLRIVGWHHGYLDEASGAAVDAELRATRPDLLFVAMGSPLQEYFLAELPAESAGAALGVGGSFDVLAGLKRDAPAWARGRGLEWLYRLAQDPRRLWRRYLVTNTWLVARVLRERARVLRERARVLRERERPLRELRGRSTRERAGGGRSPRRGGAAR